MKLLAVLIAMYGHLNNSDNSFGWTLLYYFNVFPNDINH